MCWPRILFVSLCFCSVIAEVVPFLEQGFFFDWTPVDQPVPIPTTKQCETLHISWKRGTATGPNPVAPYFLQVYTSHYIVPFVIPVPDPTAVTFNWSVPFAPGTQYQMCMFDSRGTTGGCQAIYTVTENTANNLSCPNVTFPAAPLNVDATVGSSPMSQFGWIDQCTDLTVTPKGGNPPFTMTIAPSLHPPYNITSTTMDPIVWTVSLGWGMPFFLSVASSDGQSWQYGPLHSGENGPTTCLSPSSIPSSTANARTAGAAVGGLFGGALIASLAFLFSRHRERRRKPLIPISPFTDKADPELYPAYPPLRSNTVQSSSTADVMDISPTMDGTTRVSRRVAVSTLPNSVNSQVYVLHHDGGGAPVTVLTPRGAEVVELPPIYTDGSNDSGSPPEASERDPPIELKPLRRS